MNASYMYINQSIKMYISLLINPDLRIDFLLISLSYYISKHVRAGLSGFVHPVKDYKNDEIKCRHVPEINKIS